MYYKEAWKSSPNFYSIDTKTPSPFLLKKGKQKQKTKRGIGRKKRSSGIFHEQVYEDRKFYIKHATEYKPHQTGTKIKETS